MAPSRLGDLDDLLFPPSPPHDSWLTDQKQSLVIPAIYRNTTIKINPIQ